MILVDSREGSKDLVKLLEDSILVELESGDVAFAGNGPEGPINVGVERKTVSDLINSVISGRLSGLQLPRMKEEYERVYLVVEGICRGHAKTKHLEMLRGPYWREVVRGRKGYLNYKRGFSYEGLCHYLTTLEDLAGVVVRTTADLRATAVQIEYLHRWWSKPYTAHKGLCQIYKRPPPTVHFVKPSLLRIIASDIPGIGYSRSRAVAEHFKTFDALAEASIEEWMEIEGIGKTLAKSIWRELHGSNSQ